MNDFEMRVNGKFQVVHEMFGTLDKKLDMVLEKVAEVDQKIAEIRPPSAGPMAANHDYVKESELKIRKYEEDSEEDPRWFKIYVSNNELYQSNSAGPSAGA